VNANHSTIAKMFEEEINSPLNGKVEKQLAKKNQIHMAMQLLIFLLPNILSRIIKRKLDSSNQSIYDCL
jgi:hypothetical protein